MPVAESLLVQMYERMCLIRAFEEAVADLYRRGKARGSAHTCIGQEAVAVGACFALRTDDYIVSNHRGHGHCLAKGMDPGRMMAEIMAKTTGYCRGNGGSMHIADVQLGVLGANGIVGAGLPIAVGAALAARLRGTQQVVLCFFGDGAANTGSFHEAANLASTTKAPVVFLCENNLYAINTPFRSSLAVENVSDRAAAYGMPGLAVDGNDVLAVFEAVGEAVARARRGAGPALVECKTYRWLKHSVMTPLDTRPAAEIEEWQARDPVVRLGATLRQSGEWAEEVLAAEPKARSAIAAALAFAAAGAEPEAARAYEDIYA
ncbi:MAG: thiamine pyrophosphate-dependent dehydrogenase E1 component subunit alpha [Chloroflexi bacterium]|nr:thiamine pyrophosphate-dependent dehydrogenase E1 component subunit alpha [Chloroflexota bacterium]MDA8216863.1 thiamine pyrophosphate-dependent dehydrogenase E1 component subunit alpha [Dehalococcoidales bacterium]